MAKTRRTYGWGCLTCNMQCAGFQDADGAWQEASIHTTSSGHVTDTFFRVDTQVTTIYPQRQEVRVLTALEPPIERSQCSHIGGHVDDTCQEGTLPPVEERSGPVEPRTSIEVEENDVVAGTEKTEDKVG